LHKKQRLQQSAIDKKITEIADLTAQVHIIKVGTWFTINKFLNADQQKTWKDVLEEAPAMQRHQMMKHREGKGSMMTPRPEMPMGNK